MVGLKKVCFVCVALFPVLSFSDESVTNVVWKNSVKLGATYKSGNTDENLFTASLENDRYSPDNDVLNSLYSEYGETDGDRTEGQVRLQSNFRHKFTGDKFYGGTFGEAYNDSIKQIRIRLKLGPNIGYYFINEEHVKFDSSIGINYAYERTAATEDDYGEYRLAAKYFWDFTETASVYCKVEYSARVDDLTEGNGLLVTGVKSKMSDNLSLFVEFRDEYDSSPDSGDIEYNDVTITAGLGYDF